MSVHRLCEVLESRTLFSAVPASAIASNGNPLPSTIETRPLNEVKRAARQTVYSVAAFSVADLPIAGFEGKSGLTATVLVHGKSPSPVGVWIENGEIRAAVPAILDAGGGIHRGTLTLEISAQDGFAKSFPIVVTPRPHPRFSPGQLTLAVLQQAKGRVEGAQQLSSSNPSTTSTVTSAMQNLASTIDQQITAIQAVSSGKLKKVGWGTTSSGKPTYLTAASLRASDSLLYAALGDPSVSSSGGATARGRSAPGTQDITLSDVLGATAMLTGAVALGGLLAGAGAGLITAGLAWNTVGVISSTLALSTILAGVPAAPIAAAAGDTQAANQIDQAVSDAWQGMETNAFLGALGIATPSLAQTLDILATLQDAGVLSGSTVPPDSTQVDVRIKVGLPVNAEGIVSIDGIGKVIDAQGNGPGPNPGGIAIQDTMLSPGKTYTFTWTMQTPLNNQFSGDTAFMSIYSIVNGVSTQIASFSQVAGAGSHSMTGQFEVPTS